MKDFETVKTQEDFNYGKNNNVIFSTMKFTSVALYFFTSIVSILMNRFLMTRDDKVGAFFLVFFQFFCESVIILVLSIFPCTVFPPIRLNLKKLLYTIPLAVVFASTSLFNNLCLQICPLSSYQISKSLTPIFNIILTFVILKKKTPTLSILCCFGIIFGFILGELGEKPGRSQNDEDKQLVLGTIFGILSSIFLALFSIFSKWCIDIFDNNQWQLLQYLIPITTVFHFIASYIKQDFQEVYYSDHYPDYWIYHVIGGVALASLNISAFLCLKHTSALTHNITGTVVTTFTTLLSFLFFNGETMTLMKLFGIIIIVLCSIFYGVFQNPNKREHDKENYSTQESSNVLEIDSDDEKFEDV